MKQYLVLFLLMISTICYAPNLQSLPKHTYIELEKLAMIREEEKIDSIDINYLNTLKVKHYFTKEERSKVRKIANNLGINKTKWLYKIFYIESRFNPRAINMKSGATGLIQWIPSSALACGTTTKELYNMTVSQQLDYVETYLRLALNGKKVHNFLDLYLAVFSPNAIGRSDSFVIGSKNSKVVNLNKSLMNKDSTITKKDIRLFIADILM